MLKVENGRLISDIAEMADTLRLEVFLVTVNIEKASHSVNHCFLISAPERFGFGTEFLKLIKAQLENWESYVMDGDKPAKYFKLEEALVRVASLLSICFGLRIIFYNC